MSRINEILGSTQLSLLWICVIVAAMVFVAIMYSTAAFHRGVGTDRERARKAVRELSWTVVPIFIVIAAAAPAMRSAVPSEHDHEFVRENRVSPCTVAPVNVAAAGILPTSAAVACEKHR